MDCCRSFLDKYPGPNDGESPRGARRCAPRAPRCLSAPSAPSAPHFFLLFSFFFFTPPSHDTEKLPGEAVFPCHGTVRRHAGDGHFKEKECAKSGWVLDPRGPTCVPPGPMGYGRRSDTLSLSKTVSLVPRTGDDEIACERWFSGAGTLVYGSFAGRGAMRHLQGAC